MRPFEFADEPGTRVVLIKVYPVETDKITEDEALRTWNMSEFRVCALDQQKLSQALADALEELEENPPVPSMDLEESEPEPVFVCAVGEHKDAVCRIEISDDCMQAELIITAAQGGHHLETTDVKEAITEHKITHGVQFEWINRLVKEAQIAEPGSEVSGIIAEGTPPGPGIPSDFKFLVVPFEDRVLQPQVHDDGSADMRDLG
ncbi:MAG: flagellar assembly protein A, partial [Ketobacteraceae bacterium]|nr:flagellar assembly protein A [Ketobacteraceae bacterium]